MPGTLISDNVNGRSKKTTAVAGSMRCGEQTLKGHDAEIIQREEIIGRDPEKRSSSEI